MANEGRPIEARPAPPIALRAAALARVLRSIAVALVVAHLIAAWASFTYDIDWETWVSLVDLDAERNIPTLFSSILLLLSAQLFAVIALRRRGVDPHAFRWAVLAWGFVLMAVDEVSRLHERLTEPFRELLHGEEFTLVYYAWIVPGALLVLALAMFFRRFLADLPAVARQRFLLAGGLYLGGALVFEALGGWVAGAHGDETPGYVALATVEESLEMAGAIVLVWALIRFLADGREDMTMHFEA